MCVMLTKTSCTKKAVILYCIISSIAPLGLEFVKWVTTSYYIDMDKEDHLRRRQGENETGRG